MDALAPGPMGKAGFPCYERLTTGTGLVREISVAFRNISLMAFALSACSDAAPRHWLSGNGSANPVAAPPSAPRQVDSGLIPPNSGTAPDWLVICAGQAQRRFGLAYDAIHVDRQIVDRPDGIRVAEGHYDAGERRTHYRCLVDRDDRFIRIETLPGSMAPPDRH